MNDRVDDSTDESSDSDSSGRCPPPPRGSSGYDDLNFSLGYWLGVTAGVQQSSYGRIYPYAGGGFVFPPGGFSITQALYQNPSPGTNLGGQLNAFISGNTGFALGECAAWFREVGAGWPPGISITVYNVWTWEEFVAFMDKYYGPDWPPPMYP